MFVAVEERKLFIGMLSKKLNENDVRMMFAPFGTIEDCTVLRDANSSSRGKFYFLPFAAGCAKGHADQAKANSLPLPPNRQRKTSRNRPAKNRRARISRVTVKMLVT